MRLLAPVLHMPFAGENVRGSPVYSYTDARTGSRIHVPSLSGSVCDIRLFLHSDDCTESSLQGITGV